MPILSKKKKKDAGFHQGPEVWELHLLSQNWILLKPKEQTQCLEGQSSWLLCFPPGSLFAHCARGSAAPLGLSILAPWDTLELPPSFSPELQEPWGAAGKAPCLVVLGAGGHITAMALAGVRCYRQVC